MTGIAADDPVAVQAVGRDLSLGLPGSLQVLVADRRPEGYREMNLCRDVSGKYLIQEIRRGRRRPFRLAGSRRVYELHGSLRDGYCIGCHRHYDYSYLASAVNKGIVPVRLHPWYFNKQ